MRLPSPYPTLCVPNPDCKAPSPLLQQGDLTWQDSGCGTLPFTLRISVVITMALLPRMLWTLASRQSATVEIGPL